MESLSKSLYLDELEKLKESMQSVANTPFTVFAKVISLVTMNMHYEKIAFNKQLTEHPYVLTKKIISDTKDLFESLKDISFIESRHKTIKKTKSADLKKKHTELWQEIWSRHNEEEFQEFINLKAHRLDINNLRRYIENKECVDFGCGNGVFCFALLERGAKSVVGLDFGEKSVRYAQTVAEKRRLSDRTHFKVANVLDTGLADNSFDFAVSNGVFHHLKKEEIHSALQEVSRVLRPGGWLWYYIEGRGSISGDLWDASVEILKDVDILRIEEILKGMNIERNKIVHLMDGLSATYLHSTWQEVTTSLAKCGFGNFVRLSGGANTDFDLDRIQSDPYGREKFGEGDLRILCQLLEK